MPTALTIAGSDSGAGAGIAADLKTFAALGVHGTTVVTCITAQNPRAVLGIQACTPSIIRLQLEAVFNELPPLAVKTGMLYRDSIISAIADFLHRRRVPLVVDPVMVSTSGKRLLEARRFRALCTKLMPMATLITPNLNEAEILTGGRLGSVQDLRTAAKELHRRFGCAALVKGGHLRGLKEAVDIFYDGKEELLLKAPFISRIKTHGTGCTYSAAITSYLARGFGLCEAVSRAKEFVTQAIVHYQTTAGHDLLNPLWA